MFLLIALAQNLAAQAWVPDGSGGYTQSASAANFTGDAGVTDGQLTLGGTTKNVYFIWKKVWIAPVEESEEPGHYVDRIVLVLVKGHEAPSKLTQGQDETLQDLADDTGDAGIDISLGSNGQDITAFSPRP